MAYILVGDWLLEISGIVADLLEEGRGANDYRLEPTSFFIL